MNTGAFGENFPYSNFHDLNMDWIIKIAKDFLDQYTHIQEVITNGEESLGNLTAEGLEQLQEKADALEALLQQWYDTHSTDIANALADAIIKFNQEAEQKGLEVIASIPSDYTEIARIANTTRENLIKYNASNLFNMQKTFSYNQTMYGVSIVYDPLQDCFILNGTSEATTGNINIYANANELIEGIEPGKPYIFRFTRDNMQVQADLFAYVNGGWEGQAVLTQNSSQAQSIFPSTATGMLIRFRLPASTTFDNAKVHLELYKDFTATYNGIPAYIAIANNAITDPAVIEYYLTHNSRMCILEAGTHTINRTLKMGYGSSLVGTNYNTCILKPSDSNFDLIRIENVQRTLISNIHLEGLVQNIGSNPEGFGSGIRVEGTGSVRYNIIDKCQIHGFQGGGIVLNNNSYWVADSLTITNCEIWRNYAGIWTLPKAEYNRVSNCMLYSNYIGVLNDGGNNTFVNCDLTENQVGFYIDANATMNNGHGSLIGCTINHSNSNAGYAFIMREIVNGFIIDGCNIWFGKILVSGSKGVMFSNCLIGRAATPIIQTDGNTGLVLFNGCAFYETPTITGTTPPTIRNCFTFDGNTI